MRPRNKCNLVAPFSDQSPMSELASVVHSLVNRRKCQTEINSSVPPESELNFIKHGGLVREAVRTAYAKSTFLRISKQAWSGKYRIRSYTRTPPFKLTNVNEGSRITTELSSRGVTAIQESGAFVSSKGNPYQTFLTLTLSADARKRINTRIPCRKLKQLCPSRHVRTVIKRWIRFLDRDEERIKEFPLPAGLVADYCPVRYTKISDYFYETMGPFVEYDYHWQSSLQKEVSRCMDSFKKMRQRGWSPVFSTSLPVKKKNGVLYTPIKYNKEKIKLPGAEPIESDFCYSWVAEAPVNADGVENLHVHVLMNWRVLPSIFQSWSNRLEAIWGQGFAKLELIKEPLAASNYLLKASGYLAGKGKADDQGAIRGNRYGLSKAARSPGWVFVSTFAWSEMGHLLDFAREQMNIIIKPMIEERGKIRELLGESSEKKSDNFADNNKKINEINTAISFLPIRFGRYSTLFRDKNAIESFLEWAVLAGWSFNTPSESSFIKRFRKSINMLRIKGREPNLRTGSIHYWVQFCRFYDDCYSALSSKKDEFGEDIIWLK